MLNLFAWAQQPASVESTFETLTRAIDGIDHQQIASLGAELVSTKGQNLFIGASQRGKAEQRLPSRPTLR